MQKSGDKGRGAER